jgi:hypothetical protein
MTTLQNSPVIAANTHDVSSTAPLLNFPISWMIGAHHPQFFTYNKTVQRFLIFSPWKQIATPLSSVLINKQKEHNCTN